MPGFVGCMRLLSVDGNYRLPTDWKPDVSNRRFICDKTIAQLFTKHASVLVDLSLLRNICLWQEYCCKNEIVFDACHMVDRCNPNPCKHGGICRQDASQFYCSCVGTGYAGAVCHTCK